MRKLLVYLKDYKKESVLGGIFHGKRVYEEN